MAALLTWRPGKKDFAELLLIASALPLYYLVRGSAHERVGDAIVRSVQLIHLERRLGIFWEADLQQQVLSFDWLVWLLNAIYLYGHLPLILLLALWLYFWHRPQYLLMRNAFLISGAIGLIVYLLFPVAPPRFLPAWGFVDTVFNEYNAGRPLTPSFFTNEYAAVPSLHFGWNLLLGAGVWMASRHFALRSFALLMPPVMFFTIILTGNHYFLDAAAGFLAVALGMAIAFAVRGLISRYLPKDQRNARPSAWQDWLYWLSGVAEPRERPQAQLGQGTRDA